MLWNKKVCLVWDVSGRVRPHERVSGLSTFFYRHVLRTNAFSLFPTHACYNARNTIAYILLRLLTTRRTPESPIRNLLFFFMNRWLQLYKINFGSGIAFHKYRLIISYILPKTLFLAVPIDREWNTGQILKFSLLLLEASVFSRSGDGCAKPVEPELQIIWKIKTSLLIHWTIKLKAFNMNGTTMTVTTYLVHEI